VKNVADTKHFSALALEKCKYRRFSRPAFTAMHNRRPNFAKRLFNNQACLKYNIKIGPPPVNSGGGL
jgi:hypothetical protein